MFDEMSVAKDNVYETSNHEVVSPAQHAQVVVAKGLFDNTAHRSQKCHTSSASSSPGLYFDAPIKGANLEQSDPPQPLLHFNPFF